MADGPIQPPKPGPPQPPNILNQAKPAEPNAEIVKLPPSLQHLQEQVRVKGEIVKANADGSVRIRTDQGDIDVKLDPRQTPPTGEKVDVEIEPGRPPQTARVTPEQVTETKPLPPATEAEAPPRTVETPVEVEVRPSETKPAPPVPAEPKPEQIVRLEQISLQQALEVIAEPSEIISSTLQKAVDVESKIIVSNVQNQIRANLNTLAQPPVPESTIPVTKVTAQIPAKSDVVVSVTPETVIILQPAAGALPDLEITSNAVPVPATKITDALISTIQIPESDTSKFQITALPEIVRKVAAKLQNLITFPETPANQKPGTMTAVVIGHTTHKLPVLAVFTPGTTPTLETASLFIMHTPAPSLMEGTEITLIPQHIAPATQSGFAALPLQPFAPGPWPVMDEVYDALAAAMPQAARAFTNVSPSPANPGQLGPTALFFIAAVRGGDLTQWLGDRATDLIRKAGKNGLLLRLSSEGSLLNRSEQVSQEWRGINLPLYHDGEMHKIALYYKHEGEDSGRYEKNGGQVRFIFDLSLDNMGKVQLDGLFRQKKLDLIVRSEQSFSQSMQMQMRRAYVSALEQTDVSGELSFQNKPEQWVTIAPERKGFGTSA